MPGHGGRRQRGTNPLQGTRERHPNHHLPTLTSGGTCPSRHSPLSAHLDSSQQHIPTHEEEDGEGQWNSEGGGQAAIPPPPARSVSPTSSAWPGRSVASFWAFTSHTFSVLSLLPLTSNRLSADHAIWYTAATWPRREARYLGQGKMMMEIIKQVCSVPQPTAVAVNLGCLNYLGAFTELCCPTLMPDHFGH